MLTILLIDSDSDHRQRIERLLTTNGYQVVAHEHPQKLWEHKKSSAVSCILCEITCDEGKDGVELLLEIQSRGWRIPVVFMATTCRVPQIVTVMKAGAMGMVGKSDASEDLLATLQDALARAKHMAKPKKNSHNAAAKVKLLSHRELEVVKAAASGMKNEDIARQLGLALITIKAHRSNAMRKLDAGNIVHLTQIAYMAGLVEPILAEEIADPLHDGHGKAPKTRTPAAKRGARKKP
jgi:two-component system response regulator FixJ